MRKIVAGVFLLMAAATSVASAQQRMHQQWNAGHPQATNQVVCSDGQVIGADPDPFIRLSLARECNRSSD